MRSDTRPFGGTLIPGIARASGAADEAGEGFIAFLLRFMEIGDFVTYEGREYVLRGLDPMSVEDRRADLEDLRTGERIWVRLSELDEEPPAAE